MLERVFPNRELGCSVDGFGKLAAWAEQLGAKQIVSKPLGVSGMLIPSGNGYAIALNQDDSENKRRYTLAHEIGHLVFADDPERAGSLAPAIRCRASNTGTGDTAEERLCESMAAELLMPVEAFRSWLHRMGSSLKSVPRLAEIFGTSITATAIRYCELLADPCVLVRWRRGRQGKQTLVLDWQMRNEVAGPHVRVLPRKRSGHSLSGTGAQTASSNAECVTTFEPLFTKVWEGRRWHVEFPSYRVESMAFGRGMNRFVTSVAYLKPAII